MEHIDNLMEEDIVAGKNLLFVFTKNFRNLGLAKHSNYQEFYEHYVALGDDYKFLIENADKSIIVGTNEADNIQGVYDSEVILGGGGNDTIKSKTGNTLVYGGSGNDSIKTLEGNDIIYGEDGDDTIRGGFGKDTIYGGDGNDSIYGEHDNDLIYGGNGNDFIDGGFGEDTIYGGEGNDTLTSGYSDDFLYGEGGNDSLYADYGNNYLDGGDGDDTITVQTFGGTNTIVGGKGNDHLSTRQHAYATYDGTSIYRYNLGDGNDTIYGRRRDIVEFGEGITKENIKLSGKEQNLIITFTSGESITVERVLTPGDGVGTFKFQDGTSFDNSYVKAHLITEGTDGNDSIIGSIVNDKIYGYAGNDTIDGKEGDDTIYGGDGNDSIICNSGNNYIDGGDGNDRISIATGTSNQTIIGGRGDDNIGVERKQYAASNTVINAICKYNLGDGNDTIYARQTNVTMEFGEGITIEDLEFNADNRNNLLVTFKNFDGSINIDYGLSDSYGVNKFIFADGTEADRNYIKSNLVIKGTDGNDNINGSSLSEKIYGYAGNDEIYSGGGNDTIYGGDGNDTIRVNLYGKSSNYIDGGSGNDRISIYEYFGDNTIIGGLGDDSISVCFNSNAGTDKTITALYKYNLGDGNDTLSSCPGVIDAYEFGEGITKDNINFRREGRDFIITFKGHDGSIRVKDELWSGYGFDTLKFSDGTVLTHDEVVEMVNAQNEQINGVSELLAFEDDKSVSDGIISTSDINKIIQDMTAYKTMEDVVVSYSDDINNEKELMTLVGSGV